MKKSVFFVFFNFPHLKNKTEKLKIRTCFDNFGFLDFKIINFKSVLKNSFEKQVHQTSILFFNF